jgi:hypothetical protein
MWCTPPFRSLYSSSPVLTPQGPSVASEQNLPSPIAPAARGHVARSARSLSCCIPSSLHGLDYTVGAASSAESPPPSASSSVPTSLSRHNGQTSGPACIHLSRQRMWKTWEQGSCRIRDLSLTTARQMALLQPWSQRCPAHQHCSPSTYHTVPVNSFEREPLAILHCRNRRGGNALSRARCSAIFALEICIW